MPDVARIQLSLYPGWVMSDEGWRHGFVAMPARARSRMAVLNETGPQPG